METQQHTNSLIKHLKKTIGTMSITSAYLAVLLISGCANLENGKIDLEEWWQEESGTYHHHKINTHLLNSKNPQDYILNNGKAIAIPGKREYDLYISPYSPNQYFRSKEEPGSEVICPYSQKILILGDRKKIAEKEVPNE